MTVYNTHKENNFMLQDEAAPYGEEVTESKDPTATPEPTAPLEPKPSEKPAPQGLSLEEVASRIEKARAEEKSKIYPKLKDIEAKKKELETALNEIQEKFKATTEELDSLRSGKSSEVESITKELKTLREANSKWETALEEVAAQSAQKIYELELSQYKEKALKESKINLTELVTGTTKEEIDESIARALAREEELKKLLAPGPVQTKEDPSKSVPRPVNPSGNTNIGVSTLGPENREAFAALPPEKYQQQRAELLREAKRKAGLE